MQINQIHCMRSLSTIVAILVLSISSAFAQSQAAADMTNEEKAQMMTEKQNEKLKFQVDQEEKMYAINLKYLKEMQDISAAGKSMSTMMKMKNMAGRKDKEVKKVLDKTQFKAYKKLNEEMRAKMKERMQANGK